MERVVCFAIGVHVLIDSIGSMLTGLGGTGSVLAFDEAQRRYEAHVLREGRLPWLQEQLTGWEQPGFITYDWAAPGVR